ncbi:hypothetical protein [Pedobacter sp. Leaf194]|uniref:hypothetical protein n=1 Tax=Pedobacter sp. Leaf194 TaxID=1736297 RepID=UPI000703109A|nr:hypothetical protein [Pedobacter sp. Leaf194]KQS34490.1 hypothetical protein ASG14_15335 [Pedobacter sp. Leaf194]RZL33571.1 MAG: hypothetical protein EOO96_11940 [Pedobacter sp.]
MLRKGTITSIENDGRGIITDENDQEIPFEFERNMLQSIKGATVSFDIELGNAGLVAVGIQLIINQM